MRGRNYSLCCTLQRDAPIVGAVKCSSLARPFPRACSTTRAQKLLGHVRLQQSVAALSEGGRIPGFVAVQPHEPAEQQVVIHLFHQQAFAADPSTASLATVPATTCPAQPTAARLTSICELALVTVLGDGNLQLSDRASLVPDTAREGAAERSLIKKTPRDLTK